MKTIKNLLKNALEVKNLKIIKFIRNCYKIIYESSLPLGISSIMINSHGIQKLH